MNAHRADEGLEAAREQLAGELKELGVYPRARADHRVKVSELVPGDGIRLAKNAAGVSDYVVLQSTPDEKNQYLLRLQEVGGKRTKLTVSYGDASARFTGAKVLPVPSGANARVGQASQRVAQRNQAREYVQAVRTWQQEHEPELNQLGQMRMLLTAYESGLQSAKKELRATEAKYFRPMISYKTELSQATREVDSAQQNLDQAGIFRKRGARARLEQAQQQLEGIQAKGSPDQGQIQALQEKVGEFKGLVDSVSGEHSQLWESLKSSIPAAPRESRTRGWVTGDGVGGDGSVDVRLSERFAQSAEADQAYIRKVLAPDPASRAQGRLVEVQSREAAAKARGKRSVEASYQRHWDPPPRSMGPSLGR